MLIALLLLAVTPTLVDSAHGRRARTVARPRPDSSENKYDRSITTFSDDGRLLQVEYGIAASNRGETVACLDLDGIVPGGGVCIATVASAGENGSDPPESSASAASAEGQEGGEEDPAEEDASPAAGVAASALVFEERRDKVYRIDDHALLIPTGLSGDGRALASAVRLSCRRMRLSYGEAPTVAEIARAAASMQHELTRTGGARPFGVTATVVGVDPPPCDEAPGEGSGSVVAGQPQLYQSEPGGVLERYDFCSAGRGRDRATSKLAKVRQEGIERREKSSEADPLSSSSSSEFESELLGGIIQGVAEAALGSYDESPLLATESSERSKTKGRRVDLWLIRPGPGRGGARIRVARYVTGGEELKTAASILATSPLNYNCN